MHTSATPAPAHEEHSSITARRLFRNDFLVALNEKALNLFRKVNPLFVVNMLRIGLPIASKDITTLYYRDISQSHSHTLKAQDFASIIADTSSCINTFCSEFAVNNAQKIAELEYDQEEFINQEHAKYRKQVWRNCIVSILRQREREAAGCYYYCSDLVDVHNVECALILSIKVPEDFSLNRFKTIYNEDFADRSFLDMVATAFLDDCENLLYRYHDDISSGVFTTNTELLRIAGDRLMQTVRASLRNETKQNLFQACNEIASLTYEGATSLGTIIFARQDHPYVNSVISFQDVSTSGIPLDKYRRVRKALQMTDKTKSLISDGINILGIGHIDQQIGEYDESKADLFEVSFSGHNRWELKHNDVILIQVSNSVPYLPTPPLDATQLKNALKQCFANTPWEPSEKEEISLINLAQESVKQKKGALLIIKGDAAAEAERLSKQAYLIKPRVLTKDWVYNLTSIDGALLLDTHGVCYAVGVILDGKAIHTGDSGRGARYNSSVRYIADKPDCVAIIVSEDGIVNCVTKADVDNPEM